MQHHFKTLPSGLSNEDVILVKKRKARTIRTMDAMSVLDVAIGIDVEGNVE